MNSVVWMGGENDGEEEDGVSSWGLENKQEMGMEMGFFESEEGDWYINNNALPGDNISSAFSPTFPDSNRLDFSNLEVNYFLHPKPFFTSISCDSLEGSFDMGCENGGMYFQNAGFCDLSGNSEMGSLNLYPENSLCSGSLIQSPSGFKPLEDFEAQTHPPTLFQKRAAAALRKKKKENSDDLQDHSIGNYNSDDENSPSKIDSKGKSKKGMPAKNLMAERRRRKKLNDRLYMLRSVVPKISKMDRASILGDAIDYLKELLQKINDLSNELESPAPCSSGANFYPPTCPFPLKIKQEPISSPNGQLQQPTRVEVRAREGRGVNIQMLCGRRPGMLLSTLRAMDGLGLEVQQAVISCFNGFVLDVFRAELCGDRREDVDPEQIKAALLDSAGFHGAV